MTKTSKADTEFISHRISHFRMPFHELRLAKRYQTQHHQTDVVQGQKQWLLADSTLAKASPWWLSRGPNASGMAVNGRARRTAAVPLYPLLLRALRLGISCSDKFLVCVFWIQYSIAAPYSMLGSGVHIFFLVWALTVLSTFWRVSIASLVCPPLWLGHTGMKHFGKW